MADYEALYKELAREIIKAEGKIGADTQAFITELTRRLKKQGYKLSKDDEAHLNDYLSEIRTAIAAGIETSIGLAASTAGLSGIPKSELITRLSTQAFSQKWPDGLDLSKRLWNWNGRVRAGLTKTLAAGIKQGASVNKTVYAMQRTIERAHGRERFKVVEFHQDDWVKELHEAAQGIIHDPSSNALWERTVGEVEDRITSLKTTGTRHAAERVFSQIKKAVETGNEELLDKSVKWWLYDKQLYHLKRIARTEMADAMHKAVIESVKDDEDIIGFHWELSSSHKTTDICDWYANVDLGLGRGVYPKDQVPTSKAHPHCTCSISPRVTPIKQRGNKSYDEFIKKLPPEKRNEILPVWAREAVDKDGVKLEELVRPDGRGLLTKAVAQPKVFPSWVDKVTHPDYKYTHELRWAGKLPDHVLADKAVADLKPVKGDVHISDLQARHSTRPKKNNRGAALSIDELAKLPKHLESADWYFDTTHQNLIALFKTKDGHAKASIELNYNRKGNKSNAVVTTGLIDGSHAKQKEWRLIKK